MVTHDLHTPVMMVEVFEALDLHPGEIYVDGTLGHAGHALKAAEFLAPGGTIVGFDWDASMLETAKNRVAESANSNQVKWEFINNSFFEAPAVLSDKGFSPNGVLLDLGLNSAHLDSPERGFSFQEGPLDMRMDRDSGEPASALINRMTPHQIESALFELGGERWARAIAKKIVEMRKDHPLRTTTDLIDCVLAAIPPGARDKRIHPATRTMQAIRILVTGELKGLKAALEGFRNVLALNGTLVTLAYHSGEDQIVKHSFREAVKPSEPGERKFVSLFDKPKRPTVQEINLNHRSRSARMRALRRIA